MNETTEVKAKEGVTLTHVTGATAKTVKEVETFAELVAADGNVILGSNITISDTFTINDKNLSVDLNGYTLDIGAKYIEVKKGTLSFDGCGTVTATENQPIRIFGSENDVADYTNVSIGNNVTIDASGWYAITIWENNKKAYGVSVNVMGTLISQYGLSVSGSITATTGNVPQINFLGATTSSKYSGMYLAGYAKTTIKDTTINLTTNNDDTETPIEIAAGELIVESGAFNGVFTSNESASIKGSISTKGGCGLVIKQHTTLLPIKVEINGGSFVAGIALSEQTNEKATSPKPEDISITINGGTFDSHLVKEGVETKAVSVESEGVSLVINGGTFVENGEDVTSKYIK